MAETTGEATADGGALAGNVAAFARVLRRAGLPVGPARVVDAVRAVETAGVRRREDLYWTLHAVLVSRRDQRPVFDAAFDAFWKARNFEDKMMELLSPVARDTGEPEPPKAASARVSAALTPERERPPETVPEIELDARFTASEREVLQRKDFAQMSTDEIAMARAAVRALVLPLDRVPVRRRRPSARQREIDPGRTMRATLRSGGGTIALRWRARATEPPPVVALCDISGSMASYSRVFLHFLHALAERRRVTTFVFGTRLTNVTRQLARRDPDEALAACSDAVEDWSGGTRIGATLKRFNRDWSRRVMSGGPIVLFVSDGLERDPDEDLAPEMDRLHRSCRRLVWLNPLLRWDGFEPKARGIREILPHVDDFRPVHSLESVATLVAALAAPAGHRALPGGRARAA